MVYKVKILDLLLLRPATNSKMTTSMSFELKCIPAPRLFYELVAIKAKKEFPGWDLQRYYITIDKYENESA